MRTLALTGALALAITASAGAQNLLAVDSTNDRIMLLSAADGSIVDTDFILDGAGVNYDFSTPKDAFQVGNEIWTVDQLTDQIVRFDLTGTWIATITGAQDNMRGGCFANNMVYVSNDGTGNGAPANSVLMFDTAGTPQGSFLTTGTSASPSPFDVLEFNGELLVPQFISAGPVDRHDYAGNYLGQFDDGLGGQTNPEQISHSSNGGIWMAGFSSPSGIYEFDASGNFVQYIATALTGLRGVYELGDGNLLYTTGTGFHVHDINTGLTTTIVAGGGQYVDATTAVGGCQTNVASYCTAGTSQAGCVASIGGTGTPSLSNAGPFSITTSNVEGTQNGIVFYGISGQNASPWGIGGSSFLCVKSPTTRTPLQNSGGTAGQCDGTFDLDWNAYFAANPQKAINQAIAAGSVVNAQTWYRDPGSVKNTSLSDGLEFTVCP